MALRDPVNAGEIEEFKGEGASGKAERRFPERPDALVPTMQLVFAAGVATFRDAGYRLSRLLTL